MIVCTENKSAQQALRVGDLKRGNLYRVTYSNGHYHNGNTCMLVSAFDNKRYILILSKIGEEGCVDCCDPYNLREWMFAQLDSNESVTITQQ